MFHPEVTLTNSFTKGLACAAITPGLHSILIFDAPYTGLKTTAHILAQMLECATGKKVRQVSLGVSELDDDLWGSVVISQDDVNAPVVWYRGPLANLSNDSQKAVQRLRLVTIPDLTKLSLAAARACVMLAGAEVVHLERYGQDETWQPNICWLASCPKDQVGTISPHLLERFALRLHWPGSRHAYTVSDLLHQVLNDEHLGGATIVSLTSGVKDQIYMAAQFMPKPTDNAITRVLDYSSSGASSFPRREITLARLARAIAQLEEKNQVEAFHVDAAASLIGLISATPQTDEHGQSQAEELPHTSTAESTDLQFKSSTELESLSSSPLAKNSGSLPSKSETSPIYEPGQTVVVDEILLPADPYPEDRSPVEREFASLRFPLSQYSATNPGRGVVIGVGRTNTLRNLALVNTLLTAAPFQPIRRKNRQVDSHRLLLSVADLRGYRREPVAEQMLLLLLDYTSLHDGDWQQALRAYLNWAYTEHASIGIIQVGVASAVHEYRAELVSARSILVPSISTSLNGKQGRATPLAHGLDLALRTLRHALRQGRSTVAQALLVVISDGRGNVPLEASRNGSVTGPISREGIEDALQISQHISNMKDVRTVLLNPQPEYYPDLPLALAKALGAQIVDIQRRPGSVEG